MSQREQTARPLGSQNGKITGTDIEFVSGLCNNWQVWNSCALLTSPRGCPWKHVCSKCNSALHGAGSCPYKQEQNATGKTETREKENIPSGYTVLRELELQQQC